MAAASGRNAFLGESTGFGAQFGSSGLQPYLTIGTLADPPNLVFAATADLNLGVFAITDPNAVIPIQPVLAATGVEPLPLVLLAGGLGVLGLVLRRGRRATSS